GASGASGASGAGRPVAAGGGGGALASAGLTPERAPALLGLANVAACLALLTCVAVIVFQLH
ncbi:MAG TPA: hypothetical protein VHS99_04445, partial [Chloroflexota bacterium]|nr:hypothetical protein [Chloroflexota bacterium]